VRSFETFSVFLKYLFDQIDYLVSKKYVIDLMSSNGGGGGIMNTL
jgi:hypothetical protein